MHIDITNQRFGMLRTLKYVGKDKHNRALWECLCDCGNTHIATYYNLKRGIVKSCGCLYQKHKDNFGLIATKAKTIHGGAGTKEYESFRNMKSRVLNKNNAQFKDYGGAGITICDRWLESKGQGFKNFLEDIGPIPKDNLVYSIERKDTYGNYEPSNCIWLLKKLQNRNRKCTKLSLVIANEIRTKYANGETVKDLAILYNVAKNTIRSIINNKIWN